MHMYYVTFLIYKFAMFFCHIYRNETIIILFDYFLEKYVN